MIYSMNRTTKKNLRNKARLICGLVNILQYDSENIMNDTSSYDYDQLINTLQDTKVTTQNLLDTITEIEYLLYLDRLKES